MGRETKRRSGRARLGAAIVLIGLVAAACGNSDDDTASPDTTDGGTDGTSATTGEIGTGGEGLQGEENRDEFVELTDVPGVDDTEIRFTSIATATNNPLGTDIAGDYNAGIEAYFAWRNSEGGIFGRDLVLATKRDDETTNNDAQVQGMVSEDDSFGAFVATLFFSGAQTLEDSGFPSFVWNIHAETSGKRNLFGHIAPLCLVCPLRGGPFLANSVGATKVAVLGYSIAAQSVACAGSTQEAYDTYGGDAGGVEVVYFNDDLDFGLPGGIAPEVTEMKSLGVDYIAACLDLNGMKTIGEELRQQDMLDVTMQHPNTYDQAFVAANAEILEGDIVLPQFLAFEAEDESPLRDEFFTWTEETGVESRELTMNGFLNAHLAFVGLLAAGPEFDRESVVEALRTLQDYDAGGVLNPIDWDRQIPDPGEDPLTLNYELECFNAVQVTDGEFVQYSGEPGKPWWCWDGTNLDWAEPTATSFSE